MCAAHARALQAVPRFLQFVAPLAAAGSVWPYACVGVRLLARLFNRRLIRPPAKKPPRFFSANLRNAMKLLLWLLLFVLCWPLALAVIILYPLIWLLLLPLRLIGIAVEGVFELLRAIVLFPARLLSGKLWAR
jgi:hypothetical protein